MSVSRRQEAWCNLGVARTVMVGLIETLVVIGDDNAHRGAKSMKDRNAGQELLRERPGRSTAFEESGGEL
jgi:hypothetical protein